MRRKHDAHKDEMEGVAKRLREERPEASPLELDRIKTTAMSRAKSGAGGRVGARRFAVAGLAVGLLAATTGGVLASGSGHSSGNAAVAQYGGNCDVNNGGNSTGSNNGNNDGNNNGNSANAAATFSGHRHGSHGGSGSSNGGAGNGSSNGNGNGVENGNENGNNSGNNNNNDNCNENSFNETVNNITNNVTNGGTTTINNYTIVNATPPVPSSAVQAATTSKKATTSSRHIKIHVNVPHGLKLRKVTVKVNGKRVKTLVGKKASANIELVNLPCSTGATTVSISVTLSNGKTVTSRHQYHLCVA